MKSDNEDDNIIWRYMRLEKLLDIILNERLFFTNIERFEDCTEGKLYWVYYDEKINSYSIRLKKSLDRLNKISESNNSNLSEIKKEREFLNEEFDEKKFNEGTRQLSQEYKDKDSNNIYYVNCWHQNPNENIAMWKIYSENQGIAIQSTINSLKESLITDKEIQICKVEYIDHPLNTNKLKHKLRICYKKTPYQYENEIRFLYVGLRSSLNNKNNLNNGININIDVNKMIKKIVISPYAPEWKVEIIKTFLEKMGGHYDIAQSPLLTI